MMVKPLAVVLLLLGALVSETRAQSCDPVLNLILKVNVCLGIGVGVDSTHSILASLSLPPTHTPIPQVPVRPPTPHAPTCPPSSPPAHPPSSPGPKAPPPSTPQPPASPPSTPRPPAPSPSTPRPPAPLPSTPQAPPPQPSSICCQQKRNPFTKI
ncbi:hypothetical protein K2173_027456 [Erythroxylum novogranatense]|uniref:Uncharacterized protein n=1 Tax=Erythroxylum novogranatense TaxID=1862640 RepID=A0AAV8U1X8_9ROSI|nr:hypothetical protein K2173_027456 [Erythroxylum novogranatense]